MAFEMYRSPSDSSVIIRFTEDVIRRNWEEQYLDEMAKEVRRFVNEDPEIRILIREMVKETFVQLDLLSIVTQAIRESVRAGVSEVVQEKTDTE